MFVIDTNVLIYAVNRDAEVHEPARKLVAEAMASSTPWFATWPILFEFLRLATHPRVFARPLTLPQGWSFVEALLAAPSFQILTPTAEHAAVAGEVFASYPELAGSILHDTHTAILMRERGVGRIYSRDRHFRRFRFLDVRDPFAIPARRGTG